MTLAQIIKRILYTNIPNEFLIWGLALIVIIGFNYWSGKE
jgi:hypothetical protein